MVSLSVVTEDKPSKAITKKPKTSFQGQNKF